MTPLLVLFRHPPRRRSAPTCSTPPSPRQAAPMPRPRPGRLAITAASPTAASGCGADPAGAGQVAPGGIGGATGSSSPWAWRWCCSPRWRSSSGRRSRFRPGARRRTGTENPRRTATLTVATGAVLGVLVSISSVGAGARRRRAVLPLPQIADPAHRRQRHRPRGALTLVAGIGHWFLGSVDWLLLGSLLIGSLPGIWGSPFRVPDRVLRPLLAPCWCWSAGQTDRPERS